MGRGGTVQEEVAVKGNRRRSNTMLRDLSGDREGRTCKY